MYHLFGYYDYYPSGGLGDYIDSFDRIEDAKTKAASRDYDNYEVVVQRDGDLVKPARLTVVEMGSSKWAGADLIITWEPVEDD